MTASSMKLVTIVCEALARSAVVRLLREVGAHGYTIFEVEGDGARGERTTEMLEFANIQINVLLPPSASERLMTELESEFFPRYAMIAYETDVKVRRPAKF